MQKPRPRLEVIYLALQQLRSRDIIGKIGRREYTEYGDDNALLQELAKIVDEGLQEEIDRRKSGRP
jgi:hypothetical protein